jgi:hypothetical protein
MRTPPLCQRWMSAWTDSLSETHRDGPPETRPGRAGPA